MKFSPSSAPSHFLVKTFRTRMRMETFVCIYQELIPPMPPSINNDPQQRLVSMQVKISPLKWPTMKRNWNPTPHEWALQAASISDFQPWVLPESGYGADAGMSPHPESWQNCSGVRLGPLWFSKAPQLILMFSQGCEPLGENKDNQQPSSSDGSRY